MKHAMIKIVDVIMLLIAVIGIIAAVLVGAKAGPAQAVLFGIGALVLMSFVCGVWFALSGIYHNTRAVAEAMK